MEHQPYSVPSRTLMGAGPSDVPERVRRALMQPTIGHLDPAFVDLMDEVKALLQYAFRTSNVMTIPVSGPGTAGMESCVVNLVEPGDKVIVCVNGYFGGRLKSMAERCGGTVVELALPWGRAVDPERLEQALREHPDAKIVAFVHAETSTGALSDAKTLAEIAHRHGCLTIVDTVTSLGGSPVDVDAWGLDAVYSGSQKCLAAPPGLSPITLNERALEKVRSRKKPVQSWFMDVSLLMSYWSGVGRRAYHHTAPSNAIYGLYEALLMLREEGIENAWERHRANHLALRAGLETLGLSYVVPEEERTPQLNAVHIPEGVDDARVRRRLLEEHNLEISAGLGDFAGKVWRIGLMGYGSRWENVERCLTALGSALIAEGLKVDPNAAVEAAREALDSALAVSGRA